MATPAPKVAVVTGSNKGIGFAIVEGLLKQKFPGDVYLTARDVKRGQDAVAKLNDLGLHPKFHQLDICDQASIDAFKKVGGPGSVEKSHQSFGKVSPLIKLG